MALQQRDYVVMGVLGAIVVVAVISGLTGNSISGNAVNYFPETLDFPVITEGPYNGWTDCSYETVTVEQLNEFCKSVEGKSYVGLAPIELKPCMHSWVPTRYYWNGDLPMQMGESGPRNAGYALTKLKCI